MKKKINTYVIGGIILFLFGSFSIINTIYTNWIILKGNKTVATIIEVYEKLPAAHKYSEKTYWAVVEFDVAENIFEANIRINKDMFESFKSNMEGNITIFYNPDKPIDFRTIEESKGYGFGVLWILIGVICIYAKDSK